jgi:hypothetical protein
MDRCLFAVGPAKVVEIAEKPKLGKKRAGDVGLRPVADVSQRTWHCGDPVRKGEPQQTAQPVLERVEAREHARHRRRRRWGDGDGVREHSTPARKRAEEAGRHQLGLLKCPICPEAVDDEEQDGRPAPRDVCVVGLHLSSD